ncbi:MAG: hypothetical protein ACFE9Q_15980 [Candidatus Hodarchaeota archaeon]
MLFDENHFGHYMMDWEFGNWFYLILSVGVIFLLILIVLYLIIKKNFDVNPVKNSAFKSIESSDSKTYLEYNDQTKNQKFSYCYNCGKKLGTDSSKFCPYCGMGLQSEIL